MKRVNAFLACAAVAGLVLVQPAIAAATRSADALPLVGVMSAASDNGGGNDNRCGKVGGADNVRIDASGNAVLDAAGNLVYCKPGGGAAGGGNGALLGLVGVGAAVGLAAGLGGGGNGDGDSPG
jgi:hypothetical protein